MERDAFPKDLFLRASITARTAILAVTGWIAAHGFFAYGHRMRNGYPWWGISAAGTFPPFR